MIRVKVEIVPHGIESRAEVLHDIWIENDGTNIAGVGPDEGGIGNYNIFPDGETLGHLHTVDYNIFPDGETLGHLHTVDYPSMYACGRLVGVPRTPEHRFIVATEGLSIVKEWNDQVAAAEREPGFDASRAPRPPKVEREFSA